MPIQLLSNIAQKNREANVSSTAFFYLMDTSNIDYRIKGIQNDNTLIPELISGNKYIIRNPNSVHSNFGNLTILGVSFNDIIIYDISSFKLYVDISNTKTNQGGIVYNDGDDKLYYYDGSIWRSLGLGSLSGTLNEIQVTGSTGDVKIGLTPIVIIQNILETPILRFSNGITMGSKDGDVQLTGNLNITGNILVDGEIITKTAFKGYTSDQEIEYISDVQVDAGDY